MSRTSSLSNPNVESLFRELAAKEISAKAIAQEIAKVSGCEISAGTIYNWGHKLGIKLSGNHKNAGQLPTIRGAIEKTVVALIEQGCTIQKIRTVVAVKHCEEISKQTLVRYAKKHCLLINRGQRDHQPVSRNRWKVHPLFSHYQRLFAEDAEFVWYVSSEGYAIQAVKKINRVNNTSSLYTSQSRVRGEIINGNLWWTMNGKRYLAKDIVAKLFLEAPEGAIVSLAVPNPKIVRVENLIVTVKGEYPTFGRGYLVEKGNLSCRVASCEAAASAMGLSPDSFSRRMDVSRWPSGTRLKVL